ncbi:energy transducer TonB [Undibacterium fentianense]|nr:energy transducer TonB [Undibacterium fentianense]
MNALQGTLFPRQFATGSLIAALHIIVFGFIILNPNKHFQATPKETIVLMMPSSMPKLAAPMEKVKQVQKTTPNQAALPRQIAIRDMTQDAIAVSPIQVEESLHATPSHITPTPTIATKVEPVGPKIISAVEYIQAPQADYPPMARRLGEEGRVVMQVLVNDKGRAEKVEILKSSGFSRLDESAKIALFRALFKPYVEDGKATTVLATASINFSLRG